MSDDSDDHDLQVDSMTIRFSQAADCCDSGGCQELVVEAESSDQSAGYFYRLSTEGWAVDSAAELSGLLAKVEAALVAARGGKVDE